MNAIGQKGNQTSTCGTIGVTTSTYTASNNEDKEHRFRLAKIQWPEGPSLRSLLVREASFASVHQRAQSEPK